MKHLFTCCVLMLCGKSLLANHFEIAAVPSWVKPIEVPTSSKISKYDVLSGAYNSLIDMQVNLPAEADFTHIVSDILTLGGVKSVSEIAIPYDTAYQHLQFHYLKIWRDGKIMDRTSELTFEFLRNENQLTESVYTGQVTAYDVLDDIRKGDRLEYAYTIVGDNPIFDDNRFRFFAIDQMNPVDRFYLRIVHEKGLEYANRCNACDNLSFKEFDENDFHVIEMSQDNMLAGDFEETVPTWMMPYTYFTLSGFKNWQDVNLWANDVFDMESDITEFVAQLKRDHDSLDAQIDAAINYVQDEIRYMALEDGIGSIKPFAPDKVLKQRFGDCKDKSLLLSTILQMLGVEQAYPALVNTVLVKGVDQMLPAGQVFNHCIVYFSHGGVDHWIDPTQPQQGGKYTHLAIPDYGKALVIGHGFEELKDMNIDDQTTSTEVKETFSFNSFEEPCTLTVSTSHYGLMADLMRGSLEYISRKELGEQYRQNYGRIYPNIESIGHVEIEDDENENVLTTMETYSISRVWKAFSEDQFEGHRFRYEPLAMYNYIGQSECEKKKYPVQIPYPTTFYQTTILELPEALNVEDESTVFDNDAFKYINTINAKNDTVVQIDYAFVTKTDEISASSFKKVCNDMDDISRQITLILTYAQAKVDHENFRKSLKKYKTPYYNRKIDDYPLKPK